MKLTTVLILAASLHVAAAGHAQKVTLSLKDAPLKTVFIELNKQTGYNFLYSDEALANAKKVSIEVKDAALLDVLNLCFKDQPLGFSVENNSIVVKQKPTPVNPELVSGSNTPPPIDIHGRVINDLGEPVPATITIKGTNLATATDPDGNFTLNGVDPSAILVITGVSIETREVKVAVILSGVEGPYISFRSGIATITARIKISSLNEVIVNKGYYTEKQKLSTSNVSTVTSKDIEKQPVSNPLLALQGRVPGMVVTQNTGVAGGGVTVRIQGQNSITKGNDPLYVIDGVPYMSQVPSIGLGSNILGNSGSYSTGIYAVSGLGNPLSFINPTDIESIDVLKDADATAIYGSRAANGAILITTKKGKAGATKVNFNLQKGWGQVARKMDMLNRRQYLDMRYEALKYDGTNINNIPVTNSNYYDLKVWDTTRSTDWQNVLIGGTAEYTDVNGSVSGGTENIQYLVSTTYHKETTVFPSNFSDEKASLYVGLNSFSANRKLHFQFTGSYLTEKNQLPQNDLTKDALLTEPVAPALFNADGSLNWQQLPSGTSTFDNNSMALLKNTFRYKPNNLISSAILSYNILPGLDIQSSFGFTKLQATEFQAYPMEAIAPELRSSTLRRSNFGYKEINSWIIEPQIEYHTTQLGKGTLEALIGTTIQQSGQNGYYVEAKGFANDNVLENIAAATSWTNAYQIFSKYKYKGVFSRLNYNLFDKYIINLSARRDGSSRFGDKNSFHNFGSLGAAWIISEENFFKHSLPFVNFAKLYSSYGTTGNDQIGDYAFMNLYSNVSAGVPYQGAGGLEPRGLTNSYLQWEETKKFSTGIDIGVFQNRALLSMIYAINRSSNELLSYNLPSITGFPNVNRNFPATVQNTSLELSLRTTNLRHKDFEWTSNINITIPRNKLIAFPGIESSTYATTYFIGQPISINYVFKSLGVDPTTGLYIVSDSHGNPTSAPNNIDRSVFVNTLPKFYGGFQNSIKFKGLQLDFLFQFVKQLGINYQFYNSIRYPGEFYRGVSNQPVSVLNRWQKPGDLATNERFSTQAFGYAVTGSDANYTDASFIRLKNLSLSYQVPQRWLQKVHIRDFQLYLHGQNLITITNYSGLDPENQSLRSLPPLRVITFGVKLGL